MESAVSGGIEVLQIFRNDSIWGHSKTTYILQFIHLMGHIAKGEMAEIEHIAMVCQVKPNSQ